MVVIAHLLAAASALVLFALAQLHLGPAPAGDRGVGHAWSLLAGHGALLALLLLLSLVLAAAGRLPAGAATSSGRVVLALLFVAATVGASAALALTAPTGAVERLSLAGLLRLAPLLGPALLVCAAVLAVRGLADSPWTARALMLVAVHALGCVLLLSAPAVLRSVEGWQWAARGSSELSSFELQILQRIEASDPPPGVVDLLADTRAGNHPRLREAALSRLHAVPAWQARALDALASPQAADVIVYLAAETPPDPAAFARRLPAGILQEAERVRERIRNASHPSHLYAGLMVFEVEAVLAAATRLKREGVDFAPALRALREAFDEPSPFPHPRYRATSAIDRWLQAQR